MEVKHKFQLEQYYNRLTVGSSRSPVQNFKKEEDNQGHSLVLKDEATGSQVNEPSLKMEQTEDAKSLLEQLEGKNTRNF
jgi:hypothetical protein